MMFCMPRIEKESHFNWHLNNSNHDETTSNIHLLAAGVDYDVVHPGDRKCSWISPPKKWPPLGLALDGLGFKS